MVHARARFIDGRGNWPVECLSPPRHPGAPHLARFWRDVGYRSPRPLTCNGLHNSVRVPYVRTSVRGPKTMGEAPSTAFSSGSNVLSVVTLLLWSEEGRT